MKREEYAAKLHQELELVHVSPALRSRTLAALREKERPIMKKKLTLAFALALATLLLGGVALAAATHWGVLDFVGNHPQTWLPDNAEAYFTNEVLIAETDAGILTVREVYYDGYRAHITMDLTPKDNKALLIQDQYAMDDMVGNLFRYTHEESEADRRTIAQFFADGGYNSLWLTDIRAVQYHDFSVDAMLNEDGTQTFYLWVEFDEHQSTRPLDIELWLCQFASPAEHDRSHYVYEHSKVTIPLQLTAHPEASGQTYICDTPQEYPEVGVRVDRVIAKVMPLDIYTTIEYTVINQTAYNKLDGGLWFEFIDPTSPETSPSWQRLKTGLSSNGSISGEPDGTFFSQHETLAANELRSEYTLRAYDAWTKERYETRTFTMHEATESELAGD